MQALSTLAIKTDIFRPGANLFDFLVKNIPKDNVKAGSVIAVTSKIVSLSENALIDRNKIEKNELVKRESDHFLGEIGHGVSLTIKHNLFIASAGIDESNAQGDYYILYPQNPFQSAKELTLKLRCYYEQEKLAVLFTDSHTTPLRKGVGGICLAYWGMRGLRDLAGTEDIFHRKLVFTAINIVDALAASATLMMGEGNDQCPLAIMHGAEIEFNQADPQNEVSIAPQEDLYYPIYQSIIDSSPRTKFSL